MSMRRIAPFALASVIAFAGGACSDSNDTLPPLGQILLYVDTDAPLPAAPGDTLGPNDSPGLFDRLRIEVFRPNEQDPCGDCTHEFDVDRVLVGQGRASVGIKPPPHVTGYVVRVRLFRADFVENGQPRKDATVDVTTALPSVDDEGIVPVTVLMRTEDLAKPIGTRAAPVPATIGPPQGRVGTWPGARRIGCADAPAPFEVCVPGGAFWMGNPKMRTMQIGLDTVVLRLVSLAPFYLDKTEVIVPTFRASRVAAPRDPIPSGDALVEQQPPGIRCTYTASPGNFDAFPVTCLSPEKAAQFCATRGGDLPTEAQLAYVAGALEGRLYPWGEDAPTCDDAVFSRVRAASGEFGCAGGGIAPPGSGARDVLALEGGNVVDLAGNVAEYARDRWNLQNESCWGTGILRDPLCETPSKIAELVTARTAVAGSFVTPGGFLASAFRQPTHPWPPHKGSPDVQWFASTGFRCSRPATPAAR